MSSTTSYSTATSVDFNDNTEYGDEREVNTEEVIAEIRDSLMNAMRDLTDQQECPIERGIYQKTDIPSMTDDHNEALEQFLRNRGMCQSTIEIWNHFVDCLIPRITTSRTIKVGNDVAVFEDIVIEPPTYISGNEKLPLYPAMARKLSADYVMKVYTDIVLRAKTRDGPELQRLKGQHLADIPCMIKSKKCNLSSIGSDYELMLVGDDPSLPGGYFIMDGKATVFVLQEQLVLDRVILQENKGYYASRLTSSVTSGSSVGTTMVEVVYKHTSEEKKVKKPKKKILRIRLPSLRDQEDKKKQNGINVVSIFRLLGMRSLEEISDLIKLYLPEGKQDAIMNKFSANLLRAAFNENDVDIIVRKYQRAQGRRFAERRGDNSSKELTTDEKIKIVSNILENDVFPYLNTPAYISGESEVDRINRILRSKLEVTAVMTARLLEFLAGYAQLDDRDSWSNKRLEGAGRASPSLFAQSLKKQIFPSWNKKVATQVYSSDASNLVEIAQRFKENQVVTESFRSSFVTTKWGVKGSANYKENQVQALQTETFLQMIGHLNLTDVNMSRTDKAFEPRMIHPTSEKFIDSIFTSEGAPCGILKYLGILTLLSVPRGDAEITRYLLGDVNSGLQPLTTNDLTLVNEYPTKVFVNMKPMGWCNGEELREYLVYARRHGIIPEDTGIILKGRWLYIETSPSRPIRPVMVVDPLTQRILLHDSMKMYPDLDLGRHFVDGTMDFISPFEQESLKIASMPEEITERLDMISRATTEYQVASKRYRDHPSEENRRAEESFREAYEVALKSEPFVYCELDPTSMLSYVSATIPRPDKNQAPRNTYACQMSKQACSIPVINHRNIPDLGTYKTLQEAKKPLFHTRMYETLKLTEKGTGANPLLTFMALVDTEEDSYVCKKQFMSTAYRNCKYTSYTTSIKQVDDNSIKVKKPPFNDPTSEQAMAYLYIQSGDERTEGLPFIGAPVKQGDVIIARVKVSDKAGETSVLNKDSVKMKISESGIIDDIYVSQYGGVTYYTVKIRSTRIPQKGDKYAPRNAQKGTISTLVDVWDLFYTEEGLSPDMLTNNKSLPSRMTMEYPDEILAGTCAALDGKIRNATPFTKEHAFKYYKTIERYGLDPNCRWKMTWGCTGKDVEGLLSMGPVHIMALRHMVKDKYQARGPVGKNSVVTQQPVSGRSQQGGLKYGEMERDIAISYGASGFTREMLMKGSDEMQAAFCKCGAIAEFDPNGNRYRKCRVCDGKNEIGLWVFPAVYKLYFHLLFVLGIWLRPEFMTVREHSERVMNGTLYKEIAEGYDSDLDEELEDNEDMFEEIQRFNAYDDDVGEVDDD